jgi:hypothetical protein
LFKKADKREKCLTTGIMIIVTVIGVTEEEDIEAEMATETEIAMGVTIEKTDIVGQEEEEIRDMTDETTVMTDETVAMTVIQG